MTKDDLLKLAIANVPDNSIQPLHKAMLEECCEMALELKNQPMADMVTIVRLTFLKANMAMQALVIAGLNQAETVTINYRGLTVTLDKASPLTKLLETWNSERFVAQ